MKSVTVRSIHPALLCAVLALAGLAVNFFVNYPYRPFPTDELWSYAIPLKGDDWLGSGDDVLLNSPVHILTLLAFRPLVTLLQMEWFQTLLVTVCFSLSGAAFFLGMTVQAATGRLLYAAGAMLLFLASAWSQTYLHFYTYGPVSVLFLTVSLYCFTRYYLAGSGLVWPAAAGLFAGIFFLSSSSAKLLCALLVCAYLLLILCSTFPKKYRQSLALLGAVAVPVVGLMPLYLAPLLEHLKTNVGGGHGMVCHMKWGLVPKTPFFSFFHLLSVYSPPLLVVLLAALAATVVSVKRLLRTGRAGILAVTLMALILSHTVILDLLPFTKLGRTQFALLPLAICGVTLLCASFPRGRRVGWWLFLGFILVTVPFDTATSMESWSVRREAPVELESLPDGTVYYLLREDPHACFIADWLYYTDEQGIALADIPVKVAERTTPVALIVGPTGPNSGKSILRHSILDDFYYTLPPGITEPPKEMKLPYYAHYPLFMMEEENCQYFYFYHQLPRMSDPRSQLTVYYWPARSR